MTANKPITEDQLIQLDRLIEDAKRQALKKIEGREALQQMLEHGDLFQDDVVASMLRHSHQSKRLAALLTWSGFVRPRIIAKIWGITYSAEELQQLEDCLPSDSEIEEAKHNGYILIPGPPKPWSLEKIKAVKIGQVNIRRERIKNSEKFLTDDAVGFGWLALQREPKTESINKNWFQQWGSRSHTIPNAAEIVWAAISYRMAEWPRLLANRHVRTWSQDNVQQQIVVGGYSISTGISVDCWPNDVPRGDLGIIDCKRWPVKK